LSSVGIIANPASGKDIRRLVAHASVFDNNEKVNIVRRVLLGLEAVGVELVWLMPDYYDICGQALEGLRLKLVAQMLPMRIYGDDRDSTYAAEEMSRRGVGCIITLGGDGTNRAVSKGCGYTPILPLSTGTNNVFPCMIEGTIAGLAAGVIATGKADSEAVAPPGKRLEVYIDDQLRDLALVDVAVCRDLFVGARAVWDMARVTELVLARAVPGNIGLSSIGAGLCPISPLDPYGMHIKLGEASCRVLAPVAPGHVEWVDIVSYRIIGLGERIPIGFSPCTLALDGEREIEVLADQRVEVCLTDCGPRVVNVEAALAEATRLGHFVKNPLHSIP